MYFAIRLDLTSATPLFFAAADSSAWRRSIVRFSDVRTFALGTVQDRCTAERNLAPRLTSDTDTAHTCRCAERSCGAPGHRSCLLGRPDPEPAAHGSSLAGQSRSV